MSVSLEAEVQYKVQLGRPPVIRLCLVIQAPDASDKRGMALTFRPPDCLVLRFEGSERVVGMVFHDVIFDGGPLRAALGVSFNIDVRHDLRSRVVFVDEKRIAPASMQLRGAFHFDADQQGAGLLFAPAAPSVASQGLLHLERALHQIHGDAVRRPSPGSRVSVDQRRHTFDWETGELNVLIRFEERLAVLEMHTFEVGPKAVENPPNPAAARGDYGATVSIHPWDLPLPRQF